MNWLAHLFLSEPDVEFQLGNLLADLVKGRDRLGMSPAFLRGTRCHQAIDAFTDFHPVVHRSRARIGAGHGRFAGVLIDVFYDHYLARDWQRYSPEPLESFTARLYAALGEHPIPLPAEARGALQRMIADDRLGSYRRIDGIEESLRRLSLRLSVRFGKLIALEQAIGELTAHYDELGQDFAEFFPLLQAHVAQWLRSSLNQAAMSGR
jgi:acyl carrier protein phosphodiesterase